MKYSDKPEDWHFQIVKDKPDEGIPYIIALSMSSHTLDDSLGSHNLPAPISKILRRCGVYTESELQESVWEIREEYSHLSVEELETLVSSHGFKKVNFLDRS
jgi:hypothetical protein